MKEDKERNERLKKRIKDMPAIPKNFEKWVAENLFKDTSLIFYKRKGRYATFHCSHCGKSYTYATKESGSFEGQFEMIVETPHQGEKGKCMCCGEEGTYRQIRRGKSVFGKSQYCYLGQKFRKTGAVIRYFRVEKYMQPDEKEHVSINEIARNFFERAKNGSVMLKKDYYLYSYFDGTDEWCDHNIGGLANISQKYGAVYPMTFRSLKGTVLAYTGAKEFEEAAGQVSIAKYMQTYAWYPFIEKLVKAGFVQLATELTWGSERVKNPFGFNPKEEKLAAIIGIWHPRLEILKRNEGDLNVLTVLQLEKEMGAMWPEKTIMGLAFIGKTKEELRKTLKHMTPNKLLGFIGKIAGTDMNAINSCYEAHDRFLHAGIIYMDYLDMRERAGYDMTDSIILFPKDAEKAHMKMVLELEDEKAKEQMERKNKQFPKIASKYRTLLRKYGYQDEQYVIRPAKSAGEIVREGRLMHHCVGGDDYLSKHNKGESYILLMRKIENPDVPYVTIEIKGDRIIQWYQEYDQKTDKSIHGWLDQYMYHLKEKDKKPERIKARIA